MPFVSDTSPDEIFLVSPGGEDPMPAPKPPSLGAVFKSAFDRENLVNNMARKLTEEKYPVIPDYNPRLDPKVKGTSYETDYADRFTYSFNPKDTERIISDIERENRDNAVLNAGGWAGTGASVIAGVLDPTIFLPGGAIYKASKGYSAVRSALSVGGAAAAQVAIQEGGLQLAQQNRTGSESVFNIGTGALLGAFLGTGAARLLSRGERQVMEKALGEERARMVGPQAAGATPSDLRTGTLKTFVPPVVSRAYDKGRELLGKVPVVGGALEKIAGFPKWLALETNPLLRMQTSESIASRRAVLDLASSPLETIDNTLGIASSKFGIPLDTDVKLTVHEAQVELYEASNTHFSDYRFGSQKAMPAARSYLERKFGKSEGLTFDEFMAEVDTALRNRDTHPVPQVAALATKFRKWFDTVKELAKAQGIEIGDDVLGADSFAPRVYDRVELTRNRPEFIKRYTDWRTQDEARKVAVADELDRAWKRYMEFKEKREKLEAGAEKAEVKADQKERTAQAKEEEDALREAVEAIVERWEGKSSAAAKAALQKRKEKADIAKELNRPKKVVYNDDGDVIGIETVDSLPGKSARAKSADKAVKQAVKKILNRTAKDLQEIQAEAEQTVLEILGTPDGRLPKDEPGTVQGFKKGEDLGDLRGSLNARKLPMPDNDLLPFLIRNPLDYTNRYLRQSMSDLGMIARFGDTEGTQAMKEITDDYAKLIREAPTEKRRVELQSQQDKDIRDFAGMRDRIKGTYGFSSDAFLQSAGRFAEATKDFNVATLGGGFGLAQFPDFAGAVFRHGLGSAFKDGWMPFLAKLTRTGGVGMKAAQRDYRAFGIGAETYVQARLFDTMDVNDVYHHKTPFERVLRTTGQAVATMSGITIMTDAQKVIMSTVAGNNILRAAKQITQGSASQKQITAMAAAGIDEPMAAKIWDNFQAGGATVDGTFVPNLADWTDKTAARRFQAAVLRDVEIGVITPGQEKPLFLSSPVISLVGQFKTFVAAANTRIVLANLQRRDATALSGLITQMALGMVSYAAYTTARGGQLHERPQDWVKEGIDRSGVLGWFNEMNAISAKATGGQADIFRLIGADKPLSRYLSRGLVGNLLGPTFGKATDISGLTYATAKGEWTESDTTKLRRLLPFQNLFYLRRMFDEVESQGNGFFGIEQKAANG